MNYQVDISEKDIVRCHDRLLSILLRDKTTKSNIIWATSDYEQFGEGFGATDKIEILSITGANANVIRPRILKNTEKQTNRTRDMSEVFTPSWVCNMQNNLIDQAWFGRESAFNTTKDDTWAANTSPIIFTNEKGEKWTDYVDSRRLEITCGEAPYLVSRYDTVTGESIPVERRIGLLDRKLRVVHENTLTEEEWLKWAIRAYESIYGYDYQGDNVLLSRKNMLLTFDDYMIWKFDKHPSLKELMIIANIIAWNIWQMDGETYTVPFGKIEDRQRQISFSDWLSGDVFLKPEQKNCRIMDWRSKKSIEYQSLMGLDYEKFI